MKNLCKHFSGGGNFQHPASKSAKGIILSLLLGSCLGLSSCSEEEIDTVERTKLDLSFEIEGVKSRGRLTNNIPIGSKVGVKLDGGASTDYDIYKDLYYTCSGTEDNRTWTPSQDVGTSSNKATLYAYWPYTSGVNISAIPVDMTAADQTDWLYATPVEGICSNNAKIQATLNHALANISVSFDKGTYLGTGNITKIAVKGEGIASKGTFNAAQANPDFTSYTDKGAAFERTVSTTPGGAVQEMMVIPTGVESPFTFTITLDGTEFTATTAPINLQKGYSYHYTLKLGSTSMEISTFKFTEWQTEIKESIQVDELDRFADWVSAKYYIDEASVGTAMNILSSSSNMSISYVSRMVVDGTEVTPSKTYTFTTAGEHVVRYLCNDNSATCTNMFTSITNLTDVKLPVNLKSIATSTFNNCSSLKEVIIPETVTSIAKQAFYKCSSLGSIYIPNSVTSIGDYAFEYCSELKNVEFGTKLQSIGQSAFSYCEELTKIEINSPLTYFGSNVFGDCVKLETVLLNITSNRVDISSDMFSDCTGLTAVTLSGNIENINTDAFSYCNKLKTIQLPNTIKSIGKDAFYNCFELSSIDLPNSVEIIKENAFYYCTGLKSIFIGTGLKTIEKNAFYRCADNLEYISVDENNSMFDSRNDCNALMFTQTNELLLGSKNTIIPNDCKSIASYAFNGCQGLTSLSIPNSVTSIGEYAFAGSSLTNIIIPNSVTKISQRTFQNCNLIEITIPETVTEISNYAFSGCKNLKTVIFNEGLEIINSYAFQNCEALFGELTLPNSVQTIGSYAFSGCDGLTKMTIGNAITNIQSYAFYSCSNLLELKITALTPPTINSSTFNTIGNFGTLIVPKGAEESYSSWMSTSSYYLGYSNWRWRHDGEAEKGIYYSTDGKTLMMADPNYTGNNISLKDGIEKITRSAFYNCTGLTGTITIPNSVTSIGAYAFYGCKGLTEINLSESLSKIEKYTFTRCDGLLGTFVIPNSVQSIEDFAFSSCTGLLGINIGTGVTNIGSHVFNGSTNLKSIKSMATTAPTVTSNTFYNIGSYGTLTVPAGCTSAYSTWMKTSTSYYYLGRYSWSCVEAPAE